MKGGLESAGSSAGTLGSCCPSSSKTHGILKQSGLFGVGSRDRQGRNVRKQNCKDLELRDALQCSLLLMNQGRPGFREYFRWKPGCCKFNYIQCDNCSWTAQRGEIHFVIGFVSSTEQAWAWVTGLPVCSSWHSCQEEPGSCSSKRSPEVSR